MDEPAGPHRAVGQGDVIVCSKIDRLGRTMFETMETILELTQHGVSVETGDAGRPRSAHRLGCFFERPRTCARAERMTLRKFRCALT